MELANDKLFWKHPKNKCFSCTKVYECKFNMLNRITSTCEIITIKTIVLPTSINVNYINFKIIGYDTLWSIPLSLLFKTNKLFEKKGKYYLELVQDIFGEIEGIQMISLMYQPIYISMETSTNIDVNDTIFKFIIQEKYHNFDVRREMAMSTHAFRVNQYYDFKLDNSIHMMNMRGHISGVFIELSSPLTSCKLSTYDGDLIYYDSDLIIAYRLLIHKKHMWSNKHKLMLTFSLNKILLTDIINEIDNYCKEYEYLYWIPFDANALDKDIYCNSIGAINFSLLNDIRLQITTEDDNYNGKVYLRGINTLVYMDGLCALKHVR